jgi:nitrous oxide reductase accessory protein NosL
MFKVFVLTIALLSFLYASDNKKFQSVSKQEVVLLQKGDNKNSCFKCGMNLTKFYKTSHASSIDKKVYQYCSIHCLADHLSDDLSLEDPKVVDVASLKFIDVRAAYYVVDSQVKGTMSRVSKYAFSKKENAQKFKTHNGGKIMNFFDALEMAKKDFN